MSNLLRAAGQDWRNRGTTESYALPEDWRAREYRVAQMGELSDSEVAGRIRAPFPYRGAEASLARMARGKRRVVILFDDLSRWTPAHRLAPPVLEVLHRSGVGESEIHFLAAIGSHRVMSREEMVLKLGAAVVERYRVCNHDCFSEEMVEVGTGRYGTPIRLAREVAEADLVIGLGMLCPHGFAYSSGGSKIILPGVAHVDTIRSNHRSARGGHFEPSELRGDPSEMKFGPIRVEMNEAAALLMERTRLVAINAVLTRERGIADLVLGDPLAVLDQAEAQMRRYRVPLARADKADIGVFRVDSLDPLQYYKGMDGWEQACARRIVVGDFSDRVIYQGQRYGHQEEHLRRLRELGPMPNPPLREALANSDTIFLCSPNLDRASARSFSPSFYVAPDWDALLADLRRELGGGLRVAFFPDSFLQVLQAV